MSPTDKPTTSTPDASVPPCDDREPTPEEAARLAALRKRIIAERQRDLHEPEDHDSDQSFPASDPPGNY
jgi:hypothetical protein